MGTSRNWALFNSILDGITERYKQQIRSNLLLSMSSVHAPRPQDNLGEIP